SFGHRFGADNLAERFDRKVPLPNLPHGRPYYHALDLSDYLKLDGTERRGVFLVTVRSYDPASERDHSTTGRDHSTMERDDATPEGDDTTQEDTDARWVRPRWATGGQLSDRSRASSPDRWHPCQHAR